MDKSRAEMLMNEIRQEGKKKKCGCGTRKKAVDMKPTEKAENLYGDPTISDPFGSYTGKPYDEGDIPVQDVDDL